MNQNEDSQIADSVKSGQSEQRLLAMIAEKFVEEQRKSRRWAAGKTAVFVLLGLAGMIFTMQDPADTNSANKVAQKDPKGYVNVVELEGVIAPNKPFTVDRAGSTLEKSFADTKAKGVVLKINSPGGTVAQSIMMHDEIARLKAKYKKKTIVVVQDVAASGAYMASVAADKIYVNRGSIVGSIGVLSESYGVTDLMRAVGVEARVATAGEHKAMGNPMLPESDYDRAATREMLEAMHRDFIDMVKDGRPKIKAQPVTELFSGRVWEGRRAVDLGLADEIGDLPVVLKTEFGDAKPVFVAPHKSLAEHLGLAAASTATSIMEAVSSSNGFSAKWRQ